MLYTSQSWQLAAFSTPKIRVTSCVNWNMIRLAFSSLFLFESVSLMVCELERISERMSSRNFSRKKSLHRTVSRPHFLFGARTNLHRRYPYGRFFVSRSKDLYRDCTGRAVWTAIVIVNPDERLNRLQVEADH